MILSEGSSNDASRYALGSLRNLKNLHPLQFSALNFALCTDEYIKVLFPTPSGKSIVSDGRVPISHRTSANKIRMFLKLGKQQKMLLLSVPDVRVVPEVVPPSCTDKTPCVPNQNVCVGINLDYIINHRENRDKSVDGFKNLMRDSIQMGIDMITKTPLKWKFKKIVQGVVFVYDKGTKKDEVALMCSREDIVNADAVDEYTFRQISCSGVTSDELCEGCSKNRFRFFRKIDASVKIRSSTLSLKTNNRYLTTPTNLIEKLKYLVGIEEQNKK